MRRCLRPDACPYARMPAVDPVDAAVLARALLATIPGDAELAGDIFAALIGEEGGRSS